MKRRFAGLFGGLVIALASATLAETVDTHKVFLPENLKWAATPIGLPSGAQSAVLYGDPQTTGMFAIRIKMPKGYVLPPHVHQRSEVVTVISGRVSLGLGQAADRASVEQLPAGSLSSIPHGVVHYLFVDEDAILQINAIGPWGIDYVNPKDDPRTSVAPETPTSNVYNK
jgi:quercetin dioxygenase-like cupin family protein